MTREEAAEIILAEPPFKPCAECDGMGFFNGATNCEACLQDGLAGGTGKVYNFQYVRSCEVLGLEPPKATWTVEWYMQHSNTRRERLDAERRSY